MRKWTTAILISSGLGVAGGCIIPKSDCEWDNTCNGAQNDGGGTDSGPDAITPCDPQKDVACISEEKGFFVKTGSQGGDGTRAKPFGKIQEGIEAATATKFRVYVCEGDYAETVNIKKTVGLYGGLTVCDASTWTPTVGRVSKVKAAAGYALDASAGSIEITDLSFTAPDFAGQTETTDGTAGKSSIAAFIHSGADVQAKRTSFTAQGGGNAKPTMADPSGTGAPGITGGTADGTNVGAGGVSTCGVAGGKGGTGGSSNPLKQSSHGAPVPANDAVTAGRRGCNANLLTMAGPDKCSGGSASSCGVGEPGTGGVGKSSTPNTSLLELSAGGAAPKAGASGEAGGAGGGA
ncbi:MAG: hypothetical protein HOO96_32305, partial [Polyangiaceae bacterium]|nr:hypothetical protein [Polyangiaceae bacterium]